MSAIAIERPLSTLLVAADPAELVAAQNRMIADVDHKIVLAKQEALEAKEMAATMEMARLGSARADAMHKKATARVGWLVKVREALKAGYCMMPDMVGEVVAVRTNRTTVSPAARREYQWQSSIPDEKPKGLAQGEGNYISPRQDIRMRNYTGADGKTITRYYAKSLRDPEGIDRRFIRPEIMTRTVQAMAHKLFDEIATVTPANTRRGSTKPDPIVLGRIVDPRNNRVAAFMIAWFMDTAEL